MNRSKIIDDIYYISNNDESAFFPDPISAKYDVIAVGGKLSLPRLLEAYSKGIFPWYSDPPPVWYSPFDRFVLFPENLHVSGSLIKKIKKKPFELTVDKAFGDVIKGCKDSYRQGQSGTWITDDIVAGYTKLHDEGYAHSVEAWCDGELAGGLYGVSLGRIFFGESMFTRMPDASKIAFVSLAMRLFKDFKFNLIDCQVYTDNLARFGAIEIDRGQFVKIVTDNKMVPDMKSKWDNLIDLSEYQKLFTE